MLFRFVGSSLLYAFLTTASCTYFTEDFAVRLSGLHDRLLAKVEVYRCDVCVPADFVAVMRRVTLLLRAAV